MLVPAGIRGASQVDGQLRQADSTFEDRKSHLRQWLAELESAPELISLIHQRFHQPNQTDVQEKSDGPEDREHGRRGRRFRTGESLLAL